MMKPSVFFKSFLMMTIAAILMTSLFVFSVKPVDAATYTVTVFEDTYDAACDAHCSLRDAVAEANNATGLDTILLQAGTYILSQPGSADYLGDMDIRDALVITGAGSALTIIHANASLQDRLIEVDYSAANLNLNSLTLEGGSTTGKGGGIFSFYSLLFMEDVVLRNNTAGAEGGGVFMEGGYLILERSELSNNYSANSGGGFNGFGAGLTVNKSRINNNISIGNGGGIYINGAELSITSSVVASNTGGSGGGIYLLAGNSPFSLTQSLVSANTSTDCGGGIALETYGSAQAAIVNSTVSGNGALNNGGGIYTKMPVNLSHSTIAENQSDTDHSELWTPTGGGIYPTDTNGVFHVDNSILTNNTGNNYGLDPNNDCYLGSGGSLTTLGYNLAEYPGTCVFNETGDLVGIDPQIGPLQDNGGMTLTHALLMGSTAIDAGDPNFTPPPYVDQRGYARVIGLRIDIGAFEFQLRSYLPIVVK